MREAEYKRKLIDYIKKNMGKGYSTESLKWALVKQGYSKTMVDAALRDADREFSREIAASREKPVITHEIVTEEPVEQNKPWWKRLFGFD